MLILLLAALAPTEVPATPPAEPTAPSDYQEEYSSELPRAGFSPEMFDRPVKPKADLVSLFSTDDYPLQSIRNAETGTVAVVVHVGRDGDLTDCIVERSSGHAALDAQTCRILWRRARFEPAKDKNGNPVESAVRQRIRWELPEPEPMPISSWSMQLILEFVEGGGLISCNVETTGALRQDPNLCRFFSQIFGSHLNRLRADAGYKQQRMIVETRLSPSTQVSITPPPNGMRLFARQVARLSVDEAGKPLSCHVIESEGPEPDTKKCDDLLEGRFERPGIKVGAMEVTISRSLYMAE